MHIMAIGLVMGFSATVFTAIAVSRVAAIFDRP